MAILTTAGRTALVSALKDRPVLMGWGGGDPAWDAQPEPEQLSATGLAQPIGYRKATFAQFVSPSDEGEIVVTTGRFNRSEEPTNHLHFRVNFDFNDAANATIREAGIFVFYELLEGLPAGQLYFTPSEVTNTGYLLLLERVDAFPRNAAVRESFEFVLTV